MVHLTLEMPEGVLAALRKVPAAFLSELRRAAEIAGLTRAEFLTALGRFRVSPFQYTPAEAPHEADLAG